MVTYVPNHRSTHSTDSPSLPTTVPIPIFPRSSPSYLKPKRAKVQSLLAYASSHVELCSGLSFEKLAEAIGRDEIWVAAAFYGQVRFGVQSALDRRTRSDHRSYPLQAKMSTEEIEALARVLDIPLASIQNELGSHWWPNRGLGPIPPTDPVVYRLYEVGHPSSR